MKRTKRGGSINRTNFTKINDLLDYYGNGKGCERFVDVEEIPTGSDLDADDIIKFCQFSLARSENPKHKQDKDSRIIAFMTEDAANMAKPSALLEKYRRDIKEADEKLQRKRELEAGIALIREKITFCVYLDDVTFTLEY